MRSLFRLLKDEPPYLCAETLHLSGAHQKFLASGVAHSSKIDDPYTRGNEQPSDDQSVGYRLSEQEVTDHDSSDGGYKTEYT